MLPVIGYLGSPFPDDEYVTVPFLQGLKETGYVEGQNVAIEYRWAENQYDRLPALAADLVRRRVAVIAAPSANAAVAAKAATTTIPIVFSVGGDPVEMGLVASLNRPGANLTGIANLNSDIGPKRLQLLRELMPNTALFGVLADPANPVTRSFMLDLNQHKIRTVPFLQGLKEAGFVEGQNVAIEYHYAELQIDRLPALAADLVRRRVWKRTSARWALWQTS